MPRPSVNRARGDRSHCRPEVTRALHSISAGLLVLSVLTAPNVDRADCGNLANRYTAAVSSVITALRSYESCIAATAKRGGTDDDCAAEMQALDDAHDRFADAIADAKSCQ